MRRLALIAVVALTATLGALQSVAAGQSSAYLTILLAHSAETAVDSQCHPLPGVVTLEQQAAKYAALGLHGVTGTVITSWPQQTTDTCIAGFPLVPQAKPLLIASWDRLAALAHTYGWSFVSASRTYTDVTKLDAADQASEICGSLADLQAHGLPGANGLFAYPNDFLTVALQQAVTATCYDFGRIYGGNPQNPLPVVAPYLVHTYSLNGGECADITQACSTLGTRYHYTDPAQLALRATKVAAGRWVVVQGYRFVTGAQSSDTLSWDCTSPDWRQHWSSGADATEVYCWADWLRALRQIPAGTLTVTPAQMAAFRVSS